MPKINLNIFSHKRNFWKLNSHLLNQCKDSTKRKINLNILESGPRQNNYGFDFPNVNIIEFGLGAGNNYESKVNWSIEQNTDVSIKLDDDLIITPTCLDYIVENIHLLNNDKVMAIVPSMGNGCPMNDEFLEDFNSLFEKGLDLSHIEREILSVTWDEYANDLIPRHPGNLLHNRFLELNEFTANARNWNYKAFRAKLHDIQHWYRGIHSVRVNPTLQKYIVDLVLNHFDKFISPQKCYPQKYDVPYICGGFFAIKTANWRKSYHDKTLRHDGFDELQLNQYRERENLDFVIIRNAFCLHMFYNLVPNYKSIEQEYYNKFLSLYNL